MIITLSLKHYRDILVEDSEIKISKIHLISTTPSLIKGYGGYGWIITTNKNVGYKLFRKDVVIKEGIISSKEVIKPSGGRIEDYFISFTL